MANDKKTELMETLKGLFLKFTGETPAEPAAPSKFADLKLVDGSMITIDGDAPATGMKVMVGDAPAADGEYNLEDGTVITVQDGLIVDVKPTEPAVEEEADEVSKLSKLEAQIAKLEISKEIAQHKDAIEQLKAKQAALTAEHKAEMKLAKETMAAMYALIETVADLPSADSKVVKKDGFSGQQFKGTVKEQAQKIREHFKNNAFGN